MSGRDGRRRCRIAAAVAGVALLSALGPARPAAAVTGGNGSGSFGLTPLPTSEGTIPSYFKLSVTPGQSVTASALISNLGQSAEKLKVSRSTGYTAANGGSAFSAAFSKCTGAGCWITGVPGEVTLPVDTGERLDFTVSVPRGTRPGQYLAGLTAESAQAGNSISLGTNGNAHGRAIIIEQVTVAVAVTVGSPSALTTRLAIPAVTATLEGKTVRLTIKLDNTGQTFAHGTGKAACITDGKNLKFPVYADTVLPHEQSLVAVNAPGLPDEAVTLPCTVRIGYGSDRTATWSGPVTVPAASSARVIHTGNGVYQVLPASGTPLWAIALIVIGVLLLTVLAVLLVRLRRRPQLG